MLPEPLRALGDLATNLRWSWNPETQIKWGLGYIKDVYGTPCAAQSFKQGAGWY